MEILYKILITKFYKDSIIWHPCFAEKCYQYNKQTYRNVFYLIKFSVMNGQIISMVYSILSDKNYFVCKLSPKLCKVT